MAEDIDVMAFQTRRRNREESMSYINGEFTDQLQGNSPDLIVMPEKWDTEIMDEDSQELHEILGFFSELSEDIGSIIVPGSFSVRRGGELFNSAPVIADGKVLGWQDKISLFQAEKGKYTPGKGSEVFEASGLRFTVSVCYDSDFPYYSRLAAIRGAELVVNPALIQSDFHDMWKIYIDARSLENRLPFISINSVSEPFLGNSMIVVPEKFMFGAKLNSKAYGSSPVIRRKISLDGLSELRAERLNEDPGSYGFK